MMNVNLSAVEAVLKQEVTISDQTIRIGYKAIGCRRMTYNPYTGLYTVLYGDYRVCAFELEEAFSGVDVNRAIEVFNNVASDYLGVEE